MEKRAECDTCDGPMPADAEGPTCPECLRAIVSNAVPDDDEAEDDWEHPEECDYYTSDDSSCSTMTFREYGTGKLLLTVKTDERNWVEAVKAHMDREKFWPSVWFLSDHGNWHLLRLSDG